MASSSVCWLACPVATDAGRLATLANCAASPFQSGGPVDPPSAVQFVARSNPAGNFAAPQGYAQQQFGITAAFASKKERRCGVSVASSAAGSTLPDKTSELVDGQRPLSVGDVMTAGNIVTAKATTTVDQALEFLVENRITGMPVVDDDGTLVGVVSDYDLLALDNISGQRDTTTTGLFPEANRSWKAFKELQKLLIKTRGKVVGDVMTPNPLAVRPMTNLEDAAKILLDSKFRRLPVVDEGGKMIGIITRGNVIRAALEMKKKMEAQGLA